ncbi:MAG: hypothetical protein KTR27_14010 [Leptolyngbyaceae cyanobacterium MAG.088]|nr:hypothetical protein [Leptolyngbyaceae cyanobacterium MAG.088]
MQDDSSYIRVNSCDHLKSLSKEPRQWPTEQSIDGLAASAIRANNVHNEMLGSVIDCLMTLGLIMFLLLSSSVLLGFTADRLTQGMIMLIEHSAESEIVIR